MALIRILHVVGKMHFGGMETLIMNLYRRIDRDVVQFDFMVHYDEPGEYDDEIEVLGGNIYHLPKTVPQNFFKYKKALNKFFQEHGEFTAVHGHLQSTSFIYFKIAKKYGIKCCINHAHTTGHDNDFSGWLGYKTALMSQKYSDVFFGCSNAACEYFFPDAIKSGHKMIVVKNGIEPEKFTFSDQRRKEARIELCIKDDWFVVGHVGRFVEIKNHAFLLELFAEILKKNPNSLLLLIGKGPLENVIRAKITELGIEDNVRLLGARGDVGDLMQAMDVFILPSLFEGLSVVLVEAQAAALKCFVFKEANPKEAKVTEFLQFMSESDSLKTWAEAITSNFPYERYDTSTEIIKSGFSIDDTAKWLQNFYCGIVSGGNA